MHFSRSILTKLRRGLVSVVILTMVFNGPVIVALSDLGGNVAHAEEPDLNAPSVSISSPQTNTTVDHIVTVTADATDDIGVTSVQFTLDGVSLGNPQSTAPYSLDWDTATVLNGTHTLAATAQDSQNTSFSSEVIVIVNNPLPPTPPSVTITSPLPNATVDHLVTVTADATDDIGVTSVQFLYNTQPIGSPDTTAPYEVNWNTLPLNNGPYLLSAVAKDAGDNASTSPEVSVTLNNPPDTTSPTVAIAAPGRELVLRGIVEVVAAPSDDRLVSAVQFKRNGAEWRTTDTSAPYEFIWDTASDENGCYLLSAIAEDGAGNSGTAEIIPVIVDNRPPTGDTCQEGDASCTTNAMVKTQNDADVATCAAAAANTGSNSSSGSDYPQRTIITTGNATAGVDSPSSVNTTVTSITPPPNGTVNITIDNTSYADVTNYTTATATTGDNTTNSNRFSDIITGDANTITSIINAVNTTLTGANFGANVQNITDAFTGDINFVDLMLQLFEGLLNFNSTVNLNVNNTSSGNLTNNVVVNASTGQNEANDNRYATVSTGDINISTSIINLLNTNIVGANWLFSTLNIFGSFIGDIILPGEGVIDNPFADQLLSLHNSNYNQANINTAIQVNGETGGNDASGNRNGATIHTGDVYQQTSVLNTVNTNVTGANFFTFTPHIFGAWDGGVINGQGGNYFQPTPGDNATNITVNNSNEASIQNNLTINAVTGLNTSTGNRSSIINTGNINVATNVMNLANTNLVGSNWFMGNLNLFGSWRGNIVYAYPDLTVASVQPVSAETDQTIQYVLTYNNSGLAPARNVILTDTVPLNTTVISVSPGGALQNGQIVWSLGSVPQKSTARQASFTVRVHNNLPVGDTNLINTSTIATSTRELITNNNAAAGSTIVTVIPPPLPPPPPAPAAPAPQLKISKTNSTSAPIEAGSSVKYFVKLQNIGNVAIQNLLIHDVLPGSNGQMLFQKDFPLAQLAVGETMSVEYSVTVTMDTAPGKYTNIATGQGTFQGSTINAGQASSLVEVVASPTSTVSARAVTAPIGGVGKVASNPNTQLTLKHSNNTKGEVAPGKTVSFIAWIYNIGKTLLKNVVVTGQLKNGKSHPLAWKLGSIPAGKGMQIKYELVLRPDAPAGKYITSLSATGIDGVTNKKVKTPITTNTFAVKLTRQNAKSSTTIAAAVAQVQTNRAGGLAFTDSHGKKISAWQFVQFEANALLALLKKSIDPIDKQFIRTYQSGLTLVGKRDKNGAIITANNIFNGLQKNSRFTNIFRVVSVLARP